MHRLFHSHLFWLSSIYIYVDRLWLSPMKYVLDGQNLRIANEVAILEKTKCNSIFIFSLFSYIDAANLRRGGRWRGIKWEKCDYSFGFSGFSAHWSKEVGKWYINLSHNPPNYIVCLRWFICWRAGSAKFTPNLAVEEREGGVFRFKQTATDYS